MGSDSASKHQLFKANNYLNNSQRDFSTICLSSCPPLSSALAPGKAPSRRDLIIVKRESVHLTPTPCEYASGAATDVRCGDADAKRLAATTNRSIITNYIIINAIGVPARNGEGIRVEGIAPGT